MKDIRSPGRIIQGEQKSAREYRRIAEANRKLGKIKNARFFDELANQEERHAKGLKKVYRLA